MLATEFFDSPTNSFPVESKQLAFEIENCHTEIVINEFSDKLFVVITQLNKIGSMVKILIEILIIITLLIYSLTKKKKKKKKKKGDNKIKNKNKNMNYYNYIHMYNDKIFT